MFPHRKYLFLNFPPMNKVILTSILVIALVPTLSFADNDSMPRPPVGSGVVMGTGMMHEDRDNNDHPRPPRPPMGSGSMMGSGVVGSGTMIDRDMDGLKMAIGKLTPEQRVELVKVIRAFFESKGIQMPTSSENKSQIKDLRNDMKDAAKTLRKKTQEEIKAQRELVREKIKSLREKQN